MKGDKNFYYVLIDFFLQIRFDIQINKNYSDCFIFYFSFSLSLFRSILGTNRWHETFGPWCTNGWNIEHGAIAFLLVSQWNRVEKCDEFQDSNHQATISGENIYLYPLLDEIITIAYHDTRHRDSSMGKMHVNPERSIVSRCSSLSKWKMERYAWTIAPHSAQIYIYTRESRFLWWKESRAKMKLEARKLCRIFNRNTRWRLQKYTKNSLSIFPWEN